MGPDDTKTSSSYLNIRKFSDSAIMKFPGCSSISNRHGEGWGIIRKIEEDNPTKELGFIKFFIAFLFISTGLGLSNILTSTIFC